MADVNSNIFINIDTVQAMGALRALDKQLSAFNRSMVVGTRAAQVAQADFTRSLLHNVNATGAFTGSMAKMTTSVDQFSRRLDAGKLSLREYYRYSMASTRTFGRFFGKEFGTISNLVQNRVKTLQSQYVGLGRDAQGAINAMRMTPKKLNYNDQLTRMQMVIQRQQLLNKLLNDGSVRLLNFGKNTQWAGRQLMVGFTIPLAMFAASAIKSFKEIETQAIRFKKVYGEIFTTQAETDVALENMKKIADEYTKYGLKVSETIKTAADAAAAGNAGKDLEEIVKQANKLAVLGGVAQDKSLETIIALKNAFGITASELGKSIDFLNAVENQTVLTIEDLTAAIPRVAPVIKQLGGDVKDLSFFLTAMKEGGVSAEQGANALKSGLASLINPSKAAVEATSALGINLKAIVESNAGNLKQTVLEFASSLNTLNDLQRGQIIEKIFGKYQFARLSAMFNNITKEGTQANRVMKLATASAEELAILSQRELKTQENSAMNKMQQQIEKLKAAIAPIGELFAKTLTPVIEFFVKLFNKFNELPEGIKKIVTLVVAGIAGIGPVILMTVGLVANGIANLMKMFNLVRQGYQRLAYGSKDAALGTRYMTQEELENTAVTNAMTTSHQNLSAAYVLEASSLKALTAVYQQANAAMVTFSKNNPGMFMPRPPMGGGIPPRRYNKGVAYVPGTGNTDTVPAMLTPGEAVIPKGMVAKHGGLISAIVDDKVPGHMVGIRSVFPMIERQPEIVGRLSFGAAKEISGGSGLVRSAILESSLASKFPFRITPRADGMVDVALGSETLTVKATSVDKLRENFKKMSEAPQYSNPEVLQKKILDLEARIRSYREQDKKLDVGYGSGKGLFANVFPFSDRGVGTGKVAPGPVTDRFKKILKDPAKGPQMRRLLNEYADEIRSVERELVASGQVSSAEALAILKAENFDIAAKRLVTTKTTPKGLAASHLEDLPGVVRQPSDWVSEKVARDHVVMNSAMNYIRTENGGRHVTSTLEAQRAIEILDNKEKRFLLSPGGGNTWTTTDKIARHILNRRIKTGFYDNPEMKFMDSDYVGRGVYQLNRGGVVPGYMAGIAAVPKKPLFLGMPLSAKQVADKRTQQQLMAQIDEGVKNSRFGGVAPTAYGEQISATIGHSFPVPGVGGTYRKPNGDLVFVKPVLDETAALAEQRATVIAREAHGLQAPKQTIKTMIDPTDPLKKRRIIVLESPIEEQFASMTGKFTKDEYVKQLVASALRGDKDLQMSNLSGNVLADVGTAGVFERASGVRVYAESMPSMADQAKINLLGVSGGAKRFFAESTLDVARSMTAKEYQEAMLAEINATLPRLKKTISTFELNEKEQIVYNNMIKRLEEGKNVNWADYHAIHTSVVPQVKKPLSAAQILKKQEEKALRERQSGHANKAPYHYNKGVFSVPGTGNKDTVPAMLTPGEAVIPKEMASKYAPLVDGIITDSIPGHKVGKNGKGGVPRPLPGQNFDGPSPVRPNWRGRYYKARDQVSSTLSRAQFQAQQRLAAATAKTADRIERLEKSASKTSAGFKALGANARAVNAEFKGDPTRGVRGYLTGYGKVPNMIYDPELKQDRLATQQERTNMRQDRRMQATSRYMGVGMAAMMVPMVAGAYAQKNEESWVAKNMTGIMAASMLPMLMPLINSPLKKFAVGIVALIALYKMQGAQIKKSIQDGIAQGRAIGNTVANLEEFGKITGGVSATQIQAEKRKRNALEITPVSQRFGAQFAGTDFGKKFIADFQKNAQTPGVDASKILGTQLAGAVSQGVLTNDQAESIIVNIARSRNDQVLELNARAVLRQIVGPNGQDLDKNPLEVQTRILLNNQEIQEQFQTVFANVVQKEMGGMIAGFLDKIPGTGLLGLNTGIDKREAFQLAGAAIPGTAVGGYFGVKAAGATSRALGMGAEVRAGYNAAAAAKTTADLTKLSKTVQATGNVFKGIKAARTAAAAGTVASGATGVGIPVAVGLAVSTLILTGVEVAVRKFQQGQEKKKVGAISGVVAGSQIQNLQAVGQAIDAITQTEEAQVAKLETELKIAKTAKERLEIEKKIKDTRTTADSDRQEITKTVADIFKSTEDFVGSITSDDAKTKVKESYDTAYKDYFKDAVGQQKLSAETVDAMLNRDSGLLKTEDVRSVADPKAIAAAQKMLDDNKKKIADLEAQIAAGGTNGEISRAKKDLEKAKNFTGVYENQLAQAKAGAKTDITEEKSLAFRLNIQSAITSGQLSVQAAEALISTMNARGVDYTQALTLRLSTQTPQEVDRLGNLLLSLDENNRKRVDVETTGMDSKQLGEFNTGLEEFTKLPPDIGINVNLEVNGKQDINSIKTFGKEVTALKKQFPDGKVTKTTLEMYQKSIGGPGKNATVDTGLENMDLVQKYAPELRLQAILTLQTFKLSDSFQAEVETELKNEFKRLNPSLPVDTSAFELGFEKWKATEEGKAFKLKVEPELEEQKLDDLLAQADAAIKASQAAAAAAKEKANSSWIDEILLRLKLLKEETINTAGKLKELEKWFGKNAGKTVNPFLNEEGQGYLAKIETLAKNNKVKDKKGKLVNKPIEITPEFMSIIEGLDAEGLKWFEGKFLNKKGNKIVGLQDSFGNMNEALKTKAIAEFLKQEKDVNQELTHQNALFNKLIDPTGKYKWNIEQAAWAMEDAALASALYKKSELSPEELDAANKRYAERVALLAKQKSISVGQELSGLGNQMKSINLLTKAGVSFNDALDISKNKEWANEIALLFGNIGTTGDLTVQKAEEIRNKFKGYISDVQNLRKALFDLEQSQETRSDKLTDQFAAESARISVAAMAAFRTANKMSVDQFGIVTREKEALQQTYQDQIDDYNDGLTAIEKLETSVNEKYDAKIKLVDEQAEALDKVLSLNEDIAAQQQNQLTLADALTQGDISAAAQAAADYSAQQAEVASRSAGEALDAQRGSLEVAKQKEIDALTTTINGKLYTRKQIDEAITKLQDEKIIPLEKEIEARNKIVAAYDLALDKQLKSVEIQGMTSDEWGNIKDAVALLNDAYDAQVLDIDAIATSVGGVSGAWTNVTTAIKNASLELGKYPGFTQNPDKTVADKIEADRLATIAKAKADAEAKAKAEAEAKAKADAEAKAAADKAAADKAAMGTPWGQAGSWIDRKLWRMGFMASGGFVPQYFASGGYAKGTDTIPAMVTPGEFIVKRNVADQYGALLESLNNGTFKTFEAPTFNSMNNDAVRVGAGSSTSVSDNSSRVYNYNVGISVNNTSASADDIAKVVMAEIKYIDSQRLRGQR